MSSIVKPLNPSSSYVYCSLCRQNGNPKVILARDQHMFKCPVNMMHQFTWEQLQQTNPEFVPMSEIVIEQPDPRSVRWPIYVLPETKEKLEAKFVGRIHITMGTFLAALADDQLFIITGSDAAKLRAKGLKNSAQVLASLDAIEKTEHERDQAKEQLERLMGLIKEAGASGGQ